MNTTTQANLGSTSSHSDASDQAPVLVQTEVSEPELLPRFFRGRGDPTRARLIQLVLEARTGECTVGQLVAALSAPQSRVSTHLGCLRWCGLVQTRRQGKQVYYRVADRRVREVLALGSAVLHDHAAGVASCGMIR